ncbi:MAG: hypothetical protein RLZZ33_41 [Pseudomonadota bacterium]|jgi:uncharacterized membrane protein
MRIELSPNCSLSPQGARRFFASVCVASMSVALPLTFMGYWPVLPFAGAELALLFWALRASMARRHEKQTITILAETVEIEDCRPPRQSCVVFPRHWAQVRIHTGGSPLHPSRLTVESHGRRHEVGSFLNEQERQALASRLRCLIGRVAESPPLPAQSGSAP